MMMVHNRAQNVARWRYDELFLILLRQFKRLLADQGIDLTDLQLHELADLMAQKQLSGEIAQPVKLALISIIETSLAVLDGMKLTYPQALATEMDDLPGWETTADFLELANEKGNAELRISAGASLLTALDDARYTDLLFACYQHGANDPEDVDALIAKRALMFAAEVVETAKDWLSQIED
ncbi:MAG TPA: hypothetical protein VHL11_02840, partial [Phototrophicaceae bacterium]|nr:hypothetical protein [Phototrophicaceae bacterium]